MTGGEDFAPVVDELQVEVVPAFLREEGFEIFFGLLNVFARREFPMPGKAVDVGVHREGGSAEGLYHKYRGSFMADTRQGFEGFEALGDLAVVAFADEAGEFADSAGFRRTQTAGADDVADGFDGELAHGVGVVGQSEKGGGDLIDAFIGALCREDDGHKEGVGVFVIKGDGRMWVALSEFLADEIGAGLAVHEKKR